MVAKITVPRTIQRALNYNEKKVQRGIAECIYADNFLKEAQEMNFYEKLRRFENQISLNTRAKTNVLHISLNFDLSDKLNKEKLISIAADYMQKIGFEKQPYLVYQHTDAGHPHIHLVTTNILDNGKRIDTFNIGRNQSEKARKEIELKYDLIKAHEKKNIKELFQEKIFAQKVQYGKTDLKRSITNVLDAVLPHYKYSSLAELNAVLKQYNVIADRCKEKSRTYKFNGLVYRALDENENKIGVPIKASLIYNKPTIKSLEKKFAENELLKRQELMHCKTAIDWALLKSPKSLDAFARLLEKEKIKLVARRNETGFIYGLTYIDLNTKSVFNGSELGKAYSGKGITEKFSHDHIPKLKVELKQELPNKGFPEKMITHEKSNVRQHKIEQSKTLDIILKPEEQFEQTPYSFRIKRKKQKQQNRHL